MIKVNKTQKVIFMGLLIGLSAVLAHIKVFSTIAFDSVPAFLGGILFGPLIGGVIGIIGHLFTALTSSFPLGLPIHIVIGVEMFITIYIFSAIYRKCRLKAIFIGIILNGPVSVFITGIINYFITGLNINIFFISMFFQLTIVAAINICVVDIIARSVFYDSI